MKKFLCTLLALIMIISASAVTTYAAVKTPDAEVQNTSAVGFTTCLLYTSPARPSPVSA